MRKLLLILLLLLFLVLSTTGKARSIFCFSDYTSFEFGGCFNSIETVYCQDENGTYAVCSKRVVQCNNEAPFIAENSCH